MRTLVPILSLTLLVATACSPGSSPDGLTSELVLLERACLDRWGEGDPGGFLEAYSPDITYFDPSVERRVDGIDAMRRHYAPITGKVRVTSYEMQGARAQRHGDAAVLSYNLMSHAITEDGRPVTVRWNSTTVYARVGGAWRVVHSHWSYTAPNVGAMPPG